MLKTKNKMAATFLLLDKSKDVIPKKNFKCPVMCLFFNDGVASPVC